MLKNKIVLDTNIFLSAILFGGLPGEILSLIVQRKFIFLCSKAVIDEYLRVLAYPKFKLTTNEIEYIFEDVLLANIEPVNVTSEIDIVKEDTSDNKFIELATDGNADYIISCDAHLLKIKKYKKIKIITAKDFIENIVSSL